MDKNENCTIDNLEENLDIMIEEDVVYNYNLSKEKARNRRKNYKLHKSLLKRKASLPSWPGVSCAVTKSGFSPESEDDVIYYRKIYKSSHANRYRDHKKNANRKVRRNPFLLGGSQRSLYKRAYEYKWLVD